MKKATTGIRSIAYEDYLGTLVPMEIQQKRIHRLIRERLTALQREVLTAYYIEGRTLEQIARQRGVHKSSVCRTLHRAEARLRQYLKY